MSNHTLRPLSPWITESVKDLEALEFLTLVLNAIEVWDDIIDKDDRIAVDDIHNVFTQLLVKLPANQFYQHNYPALAGMVIVCTSAWHTSNAIDETPEGKAHGYTLRKEFINLVVLCVALTSSVADARKASLLGWTCSAADDSFDEYIRGE
jgi:hypothetical protein